MTARWNSSSGPILALPSGSGRHSGTPLISAGVLTHEHRGCMIWITTSCELRRHQMSMGDPELADLASAVLSREANALAALVSSVETGVVRVALRVLATP